MSERTAPALAKIDALIPVVASLPPGQARDYLVSEVDALRRAVAAFHMEAIRFRMFRVDRALKAGGDQPDSRAIFEALRHELETAGFHTRSHTAP